MNDSTEQVHRFRTNLRFVPVLVALGLGLAAFNAAIGLGMIDFTGSRRRYDWMESVWPLFVLVGVLVVIRGASLTLLDAVVLTNDSLIVRTEPLRIVKRTISRSDIAAFGKLSKRPGRFLHVHIATGKLREINLRLVSQPEKLVESVKNFWPEKPWRPDTMKRASEPPTL